MILFISAILESLFIFLANLRKYFQPPAIKKNNFFEFFYWNYRKFSRHNDFVSLFPEYTK